MGKCKNCGKETLGGYEYCLQCARASRKPRQSSDRAHQTRRDYGPSVPAECIFGGGFYGNDGYLRKEIFMDAAEKMARILQSKRMTQASIRHLFNMVKAVEIRLKADRNLPMGFVRENFFKFVRQTDYQVGRGIIPGIFRELVDAHKDIVVKDKEEFKGFVEYLTSIVARMKQK